MLYRIICGVTLCVVAFCGILSVLFALGYRINTSQSMPVGIWHVKPVTRALKKGDIVWLCPPTTAIFKEAVSRSYIPKGSCSSGAAHLIKPVAAISGDTVIVSDRGIRINGRLISNSQAQETDGSHRQLPHIASGTYQVRSNTIWLISSYSHKSFDSRYFGSIPISYAEGTIKPVLVLSRHNSSLR